LATKATPIDCIWFSHAAKTFGICQQKQTKLTEFANKSKPKLTVFCPAVQRKFLEFANAPQIDCILSEKFGNSGTKETPIGCTIHPRTKNLGWYPPPTLPHSHPTTSKFTFDLWLTVREKSWNFDKSNSNKLCFVQLRSEIFWNLPTKG
jgi:hypothetical protein